MIWTLFTSNSSCNSYENVMARTHPLCFLPLQTIVCFILKDSNSTLGNLKQKNGHVCGTLEKRVSLRWRERNKRELSRRHNTPLEHFWTVHVRSEGIGGTFSWYCKHFLKGKAFRSMPTNWSSIIHASAASKQQKKTFSYWLTSFSPNSQPSPYPKKTSHFWYK